MPIAGHPKKLAYDVAQGYHQFTPNALRQYSHEELKVFLFNINFVLRELRGKQIPLEDIDSLKDRNIKIQRLNHALNVIQTFCIARRIHL